MKCCLVNAVVSNTKGKDFSVQGKLWADGTLRLANPRPKKYAEFQFLLLPAAGRNEDDPKRLFWLEDNNSDADELSPFRLKSMLMVVAKKTKK